MIQHSLCAGKVSRRIFHSMGKVFKKLCRLAGETVVKYRLIEDGDRILVGVSGGKDSVALMHILNHLQQAAPVKFSLECVTFDPGFPEFGIHEVQTYCQKQKWSHHTLKMDIASIVQEKGFVRAPCVLCSRLRRGKLYGMAKELGCNKLALGQHLDDIISSMLISLCRGQGITTMAPKVQPDAPEHPVIIRPLALVPEALIKEYTSTLALPQAGICRYREQLQQGDRVYFQGVIEELSRHIPDLRSNIAHSLTKVEIGHLLTLPEEEK